MADVLNGKRPVAEESKCRTRGDDVCQLDVVWE